jgi:hypothetical protein
MAMMCRSCGTVAEPKTLKKGTSSLEVLLWLCFLLPGIAYSMWRWNTRHNVCPACGGSMVTDYEASRPSSARRQTDSVEKLAKR